MICRSCGNTLKENEKFCTLCGTYNDPSLPPEENDFSLPKKEMRLKKSKEEPIQQDDSFSNQEPINSQPIVEEEESYMSKDDPAMVAYIGEDYKWIAERPFNIYALLLSWIYFLYRKLYLVGIIGLVVTGIIIKFASFLLIPYIILSMVGCGLFFNKFYLDTVEKKVNRIKDNANEMDNVELICKKKGGVNVIVPLIIFLLFLAIMLLSNFKLNLDTREPNYWEDTSTNLANCKSICRKIHEQMQTPENEIEAMGCEVVTNSKGSKIYNIYIKSNSNGKDIYVLYENDPNGYMEQKGDSDRVKELEASQKEKELSEDEKEFLETSKNLRDDFTNLKNDSIYEDEQIKEYKNTKAKTHFVFSKEDLYK